MTIYFENKQIEKLCTDKKHAIKKLGPITGKKVIETISFIYNQESLADVASMPQFRFHKLKGDRKEQYSITPDRNSKYRIIVHPLDKNGKILLSGDNEKEMLCTCLSVNIVEVSEHYD